MLIQIYIASCQIEEIINLGLGLAKDHCQKPVYTALKTFADKPKELQKQPRGDASHRDKWSFVSYDSFSP